MLQEESAYDFGLRLKKLRKKRKLTQRQLADKLGLTRSTVCSYENNTITPPTEIVKRLAVIFDVSADYLLGLDRRRIIVLDNMPEEQAKMFEECIATMEKYLKNATWLYKG